MKISEIMNGPVETVFPNLKVSELEQVLSEHRISGAPVVANTGELVGIVSKTDLLRSFVEDAGLLEREAEIWEIMTSDVLCVQTGDSVEEVAKEMVEAHVHRVLVYDGESLVGIASTLDMLATMAATDAGPS